MPITPQKCHVELRRNFEFVWDNNTNNGSVDVK